ncbi:MAG TPA: gamma-glutamylcyclotransferase family protein [Terriglobia bacterium]|nr:gamma-glutamylcyclotransferase family protein [Terriglobia bacterium]
MSKDAYVFGYGSLIERASRTRTNPDAVGAWPARVTGFRRGWFHHFTESENVGKSCTFLGAVKETGKTINGVIYYVADFEKTKERETGYTPEKVDTIEMLDGAGSWDSSKEVYLFVSNEANISEPSKDFPMVESYVDICVNGCQEIEALYRSAKGFVQEFITSSTGWNNKYWVNDRLYPRRPFIYVPNAEKIDKALLAGNVLQYVQLHDLS